jgi:hypothetical protein
METEFHLFFSSFCPSRCGEARRLFFIFVSPPRGSGQSHLIFNRARCNAFVSSRTLDLNVKGPIRTNYSAGPSASPLDFEMALS